MGKYLIYGNTDVGIVKEKNQDSFMLKEIQINDEPVVFGMVCDGLGGLEYGEIASSSVVRKFQSWFMEDFPKLAITEFKPEQLFNEWATIVSVANRKILEYGEKNGGIRMGTTVSGILIYKKMYYCINVGDSRIYEIDILGNIRQVTKDQSLIQKEIDEGRLTEEEARYDSRQNVLLECIGAKLDVSPDFYLGVASKNTTYLFCSDGFRHVITKDELVDAFSPTELVIKEDIRECVNSMIELIKSRGETDNITAGVIRC